MQLQTTYSQKNNQERRIRFKYCLLLTACCMLVLSGCNRSFEPFKENNTYYFSIYGYLDVSADTQWVRVSPARQ